jgi:hypothetical protein
VPPWAPEYNQPLPNRCVFVHPHPRETFTPCRPIVATRADESRRSFARFCASPRINNTHAYLAHRLPLPPTIAGALMATKHHNSTRSIISILPFSNIKVSFKHGPLHSVGRFERRRSTRLAVASAVPSRINLRSSRCCDLYAKGRHRQAIRSVTLSACVLCAVSASLCLCWCVGRFTVSLRWKTLLCVT